MLALAKEHRPKVILCGGSAYPRTVETWEFRKIADEVGALLWCDMAHFSGLVAAGLHPNPVPDCDVVTSTTHKTLAGPRAGFILCREEHASAIDRAIFPGLQGGPLEHAIAAKATCFKIAASEAFREYQTQVRANADALAAEIMAGGLDVLTGGTDTHLLQLDLRRTEWTGKDAEERLHAVKLTTNRNTVPFDERPPTVASGVRIGTPAATMRGFDEEDFREVGRIIVGALADGADVPGSGGAQRGPVREAAAVRRLPRIHELLMDSHVIEVDHPLVRHKLGLLRDVTTTTQQFRQLVNELTLLLTYEATKTLADEAVEIETPLERMGARRISGKKVAVCPILRAGVGMLDGVLSLIPGARVGFIGLYRDEETLQPVEYYVKLPNDIAERDVLLLDPMLATGNSTAAAVETVKARRRDLDQADRADRDARGNRADPSRPPRRVDRGGVGRPRPEREGLHRPGARGRRRQALRHEVDGDERASGQPGGPVRRRDRTADRHSPDPRGRRHGANPRRRRQPGRAAAQPAARSHGSAGSRSSSASSSRRSRSSISRARCAASCSAPQSPASSARSTTSAGCRRS